MAKQTSSFFVISSIWTITQKNDFTDIIDLKTRGRVKLADY